MAKQMIIYGALIMIVSLFILLARRLGIAYPILLVLAGIVFSFIPGVPNIRVDPDIVFLIILPPVLYYAAQRNSWDAIWKWRRIIGVLALGYVLLTSTVVALVACWLVPGLTLSQGFLLGAIVSPPDAAAATAVLRKINIPKGLVTILEGESLLNDATSLTIFRFALVAITTNRFVWYEALGSFSLVVISGLAIGIIMGIIFYALYKYLPTTSNLDIAISFALPYFSYLTAEYLKSSGVLAVVSAGLVISYQNHNILAHSSRLKSNAVWPSLTFILNAIVFFLIGIQFPGIIKGLRDITFIDSLAISLAISFLIIVLRIIAGHFSSLFTAFIGKYIKVAVNHPGWRNPMIISLSGMRGVVSLASALSIPLLLPNGHSFPYRDLILFITFIVIAVTLVIQGLALPWLVRLIKPEKLPGERDNDEQILEIERFLFNAAREHLSTNFKKEVRDNPMLKNKMDLINYKAGIFNKVAGDVKSKSGVLSMIKNYKKVMMEVTEIEREQLNELRKSRQYDDDVIRIMENRLDLEEERFEDNID